MTNNIKLPNCNAKIAAIAGRLGQAVLNHTALLNSDDEGDSEEEILDHPTFKAEIFDWEKHEERIADYAVHCIRVYTNELEPTSSSGNDQRFTDKSHVEESLDYIFDSYYKKFLAKMVFSSAVHKLIRLKNDLKELKYLKNAFLLTSLQMEDRKSRFKEELYNEADKIVAEWLPELTPDQREMAPKVIPELVRNEVENMKRMKEGKPEEIQAAEDLKKKERLVLEKKIQVREKVIALKRMKDKWRRNGQWNMVTEKLYRRWKCKRRKTPLKDMWEIDELCPSCKANEQEWRSYRRDPIFTDQLTLEDAKKFHTMLFKSGRISTLVNYFTILLRKENIKFDGDCHQPSQ